MLVLLNRKGTHVYMYTHVLLLVKLFSLLSLGLDVLTWKISQHPELIGTLSAIEPGTRGFNAQMPMLIGFVSTISLFAGWRI